VTINAIRATIEQRIATEMALAPPYPVHYGNAPFNPPNNSPWLDVALRFGDDAYAFEELVAEIGSAFVCAQTGIALEGLQHDRYVASWLKVLKGDKRAIFTASSQAKKAAEFLMASAEQEEALAA